MALQIPQMPNFTAQTPDILGAQQKQATLSQMLNANALQKQLAPLQVQEQQEKAKAATLQNQVTQEDLNNQVAFGKMFLASEGDTNKLTEMISDPKQNFGLTPRGIGPALQQVIAHREAMYKMDEATAAHTDAKNNIVLPLLKQLDDATKQSDPRTARPCTRWTKRQRRTLMQKTTSFYLYSSNWTTPLSNQIA